ncbi:TPA: hypothetical protein DF272_02080 [Candidatus Falkowbacteria bacterium]|nr:hypothetical protein [Candidatus Falkowbacteria bacterium]
MTVGLMIEGFEQRELLGRAIRGKKAVCCLLTHMPVCDAELVLPVEGGHIRVAKFIEREKLWLADHGLRELPNGFKLTKLSLSDLRQVYVIILMTYNLSPDQRKHVRECVSIMGGDQILASIADDHDN